MNSENRYHTGRIRLTFSPLGAALPYLFAIFSGWIAFFAAHEAPGWDRQRLERRFGAYIVVFDAYLAAATRQAHLEFRKTRGNPAAISPQGAASPPRDC